MPYVTPESPVTTVRTSTPPTKLYRALASSNIPSLDGLRAVSVILVVFVHLHVPYIPEIHGVLTFFVLSGFLITWLLLKRGVLEDFWRSLTSWTLAPAVTLAFLITSIALNERFHYRYKYLMGFSLDPILIALFMVQVIALGDRALRNWLNWPVIRYLGRVSYAMYLDHGLANDAALHLLRGRSLWFIAPAGVVIGTGFASVSYLLWKNPSCV